MILFKCISKMCYLNVSSAIFINSMCYSVFVNLFFYITLYMRDIDSFRVSSLFEP